MFFLVLLLIIIAAISYYMGCLNTLILASHLIFKKNLLAYERSNLGITRFLKSTNAKQLILLLLLTLFKFGFPVLLGGWLMSIYDIPEIGRAFAMLCTMLGNNFPYMSKFKGQSCLAAFGVSAIFLNGELGFAVLIIFAGVYFLSRYVSLSAMVGAVSAWILAIVVIDIPLVTWMMLVCALIVFIDYRKSIPRLIKKTEPKFIYKKDLSYMFDE